MRNNLLYITVFSLSLFSCEFFKMKSVEQQDAIERKPIARAHDAYLYPEDLEGIVPKGMPTEDSIARVHRYIDTWAKKQLLIKEASENIDFDEADIERKILDYRYSLMGYEYQSYYINKNLNKEVTDEEVAKYYEENIDNFILRQNIIQGLFVSLPNEAPKTEDVKKLMLSDKDADYEKLMAYCLSFASTYQLNDTIWMNFADIVKGTPLAELPNKVEFLQNTDFTSVEDSLNTYFLKINEFKIIDDLSPMDFVRNQIRDIILNKRKIELARKLEQDVYDKAKKNNEIEVFPY